MSRGKKTAVIVSGTLLVLTLCVALLYRLLLGFFMPVSLYYDSQIRTLLAEIHYETVAKIVHAGDIEDSSAGLRHKNSITVEYAGKSVVPELVARLETRGFQCDTAAAQRNVVSVTCSPKSGLVDDGAENLRYTVTVTERKLATTSESNASLNIEVRNF